MRRHAPRRPPPGIWILPPAAAAGGLLESPPPPGQPGPETTGERPISIRIIARLIARPDAIDALRAECLAMLEPTRKEAGCVRYELLANIANPAEFTFVEEWADQAAIDAHMATPHLKGLVANTQALLAEPLDVRLYTLA